MTAKAKFALGQIVATPGAQEALSKSGDNALDYLRRHQSGDWGELCAEDKSVNDEAVAHQGRDAKRVLSAYRLSDQTGIWIITEWDRSVTTILLPEEY